MLQQQTLNQAPSFRRTVSILAFGFAAMFLVQYGAYTLIAYMARYARVWFTMDTWTLLNDLCLYGMGLPVLLLVGQLLPSTGQLPLKPKRSLPPLAFGRALCVGYAGMIVANLACALVLGLIRLALGRSPVQDLVGQMLDTLSPAGALLLVVLVPAIMEELVFRGYLYKKLIRFGEGPYILVSALFFGTFHANFEQFLYAFVLGAWLAYLVCRTGTVLYGMMIHLFVNFYSANVLVQIGDGMVASVLSWVMLLVVGLGCVLFLEMRRSLFVRPALVRGSLVKQVVCNPGMIVWLLVFLAVSIWSF